MVQSYIIQSEFGDEYKLRMTSEEKWMLPESLCQLLKDKGIEVVDVELERSKGTSTTSLRILSLIESCIADFLLKHNHVISVY